MRDIEAYDQLHESVDDILHRVWDPIGIASEPDARDEYCSYVSRVVGLLREGAGEAALSAYLDYVVTKVIGLPADEQHATDVARLLIATKEDLDRAT